VVDGILPGLTGCRQRGLVVMGGLGIGSGGSGAGVAVR
jgi:hypothetical protein